MKNTKRINLFYVRKTILENIIVVMDLKKERSKDLSQEYDDVLLSLILMHTFFIDGFSLVELTDAQYVE